MDHSYFYARSISTSHRVDEPEICIAHIPHVLHKCHKRTLHSILESSMDIKVGR